MNRRTLLASGAAAAASGAGLGAVSAARAPDPAIAAFQAWRAADERWRPVLEAYARLAPGDPRAAKLEPINDALEGAEWAALKAVGEVEATTIEGLRLQILAAFSVYGDLAFEGDLENPADFTFHEGCFGPAANLLSGVYASAQRLAGEASA